MPQMTEKSDSKLLSLATVSILGQAPRSTLEPDDLIVAENTIAVFNLDGDSTLINNRLHKIKSELPLIKEYWEELINDVNGDLQELLDDELQSALDRIESYEYSTALRHAWLHNEEY